jgi:polar amino acid transport system substrate-binding protein
MTHAAWALLLMLLCPAGQAQEAPACAQTLRIVRHMDHVDTAEDRFLARVMRRSGCGLQVLRLPYSATLQRRLDMLAAGDIDLMVGVSRRPERESFGLFSVPFRTETVRLWARAGEQASYVDRSLAALAAARVRIVGPSSGWFGEDYDTLRRRADPALQTYKPFHQGVALLLGGRGDLLLADELWVEELAPAQRAQLEALPGAVYTEALHFMYSRRTVEPSTVQRIDAAIGAALADPAAR